MPSGVARPGGFRTTAALLVMAMLFCGGIGTAALAADASPSSLAMAPDFSRPTLDQKTIRLSDLRGKVVLLNFWASWCGPCLEEMPLFQRWQHDYARRGLQVVGISMDDGEASAQAAYRKLHLGYPVVMGDEKLADLFGGIYGLPVSLLIDRKGQIRSRYKGATDLKDMKREIEEQLGP